MAGECSLACMLSRSAYIQPFRSAFSSDLTRLCRIDSCLYVYLPCFKASGHTDRMCPVVARVLCQSLQWDETWSLYLCRFIGVERVLDPALSI